MNQKMAAKVSCTKPETMPDDWNNKKTQQKMAKERRKKKAHTQQTLSKSECVSERYKDTFIRF